MADPASNDLPYGQFGQAVYGQDEQTWDFGRKLDEGIVIRPLGEPRLVDEPADDLCAPHTSPTSPLNSSERRPKEVRDLVRRFPELQPASGLLAPLLRVSEAIEAATARHDPLQSNLLAFGSISSEASHQTTSIAAYPCGPTGSDMRTIQVQTQRRGWDDTKSAWIEVPTVHGEKAVWQGEGAPIQQICSAHAIERSDTFLAVRMLTRTLIFRPTLRKASLLSNAGSRLDTNLCFEVPVHRTADVPHVDVVFNPWYTRQVGVIDQAAQWSIWELEGRSTTSGRRICQGLMRRDPESSVKGLDDGWARITWVCNPDTVAVCTRRELTLYNITSGDPGSTGFLISDKSRGIDWYLDMLHIPSHPAHLAVLTSNHLTLYLVEKPGADAAKAKTVMRMRHFCNSQDTTLSLAAFALGDAVLVILRSSIEPLIVVYRLQFNESGGIHASMPTELALPNDMAAPGNHLSIAGLHLAGVEFGARRQEPQRSLALQYRDSGLEYANLVLLSKDLTLEEILCTSAPAAVCSRGVGLPTWEAKLSASATRLRKETFVIDNADVTEGPDVDLANTAPMSSFAQRRGFQAPYRFGPQWTISCELCAQKVNDGDGLEADPMRDVLQAAESFLRDPKMDGAAPWRTLSDLASGEVRLPDIEGSMELLESLANIKPGVPKGSQDDPADAQSNMTHTIRSVGSQPTTSLATLYSNMVKDWITPLAPAISGRVRLAKEQLVRRAAAEVALATHVIVTQPPEPEPQPETQQSQQTWDLPVRAGPSALQLPGSSSQIASQQSVLPTPSPSATPSVTIGSSYPSTFTAPEVSRLSRYMTFSKPASSALPRSLNNVLSHWHLGNDPATYDWRAISRHIAQCDDEADEQMTEKDRARMQRRAERHIRRQRRETAASQAAQLASSQALEIVSSSQPQQAPRVESQRVGTVGSSQSQGLGIGSASQVMPGRFSGKPPKKKRKQGF